ncbi:hypothetical protein C8R44DRAFT_737525 [Mycena epipterygia]|nr:hypothetical protein C8R44DRAFT_737525 [Mycena epipterygia]
MYMPTAGVAAFSHALQLQVSDVIRKPHTHSRPENARVPLHVQHALGTPVSPTPPTPRPRSSKETTPPPLGALKLTCAQFPSDQLDSRIDRGVGYEKKELIKAFPTHLQSSNFVENCALGVDGKVEHQSAINSAKSCKQIGRQKIEERRIYLEIKAPVAHLAGAIEAQRGFERAPKTLVGGGKSYTMNEAEAPEGWKDIVNVPRVVKEKTQPRGSHQP